MWPLLCSMPSIRFFPPTATTCPSCARQSCAWGRSSATCRLARRAWQAEFSTESTWQFPTLGIGLQSFAKASPAVHVSASTMPGACTLHSTTVPSVMETCLWHRCISIMSWCKEDARLTLAASISQGPLLENGDRHLLTTVANWEVQSEPRITSHLSFIHAHSSRMPANNHGLPYFTLALSPYGKYIALTTNYPSIAPSITLRLVSFHWTDCPQPWHGGHLAASRRDLVHVNQLA